MKYNFVLRLLVSLIFVLGLSVVCSAQLAPKTWVSGTGNDANPCTRTAPCASFAAALSKTANAGEIDVVDSGDYGVVTITKSVSIEAVGSVAGVLSQGITGIIVGVGPNDNVVLRGLTIDGQNLSNSPGTTGIVFVSGGALHIENCTVNGYATNGIDINPNGNSANSQVFVKDTIVRNNNLSNNVAGVFIHPQSGGAVTVSLDGVRIERNGIGLRAEDNSRVTMRNTIVTNSAGRGVTAFSASAPTQITMESCLVAFNGDNGITAEGAAATVTISNVTVTDNAVGLKSIGGGAIVSFGNNRIRGNTVDGVPTLTVPQQ